MVPRVSRLDVVSTHYKPIPPPEGRGCGLWYNNCRQDAVRFYRSSFPTATRQKGHQVFLRSHQCSLLYHEGGGWWAGRIGFAGGGDFWGE